MLSWMRYVLEAVLVTTVENLRERSNRSWMVFSKMALLGSPSGNATNCSRSLLASCRAKAASEVRKPRVAVVVAVEL